MIMPTIMMIMPTIMMTIMILWWCQYQIWGWQGWYLRWALRRGSEKELSPVLPSPPVQEASPGPESRLSRLFSLRRSVGPCAAPSLDQVQSQSLDCVKRTFCLEWLYLGSLKVNQSCFSPCLAWPKKTRGLGMSWCWTCPPPNPYPPPLSSSPQSRPRGGTSSPILSSGSLSSLSSSWSS